MIIDSGKSTGTVRQRKFRNCFQGATKLWFLECWTLTDPFYCIFLISTKRKKKRKTSCKAKLKKERRKIPLIKCKSEQGFTPSWLKSIVKSIVTSKQGWSDPGMLQDQFCASWGWWQVENSSERSSWQQNSYAWAPGSGLGGSGLQARTLSSYCLWNFLSTGATQAAHNTHMKGWGWPHGAL